MSKATCEVHFLEEYLAAADAADDAKLRRVLQLLPIVMAHSTSTAFSVTLSTMEPPLLAVYHRVFPDYRSNYRYALIGTAIDALENERSDHVEFLHNLQSKLHESYKE